MAIKEFNIKLIVIFISAIYPFIMIYGWGSLDSISQYWNTPFQPLFIISNILCSYFFFTLPNWRIPSFFLLLLTSFSCVQFRITHNILAICFYFGCLYSLFKNKRLKFYRVLYILSIPFYFYSIILGEIISILTLCSFHLQIIIYKEKLEKLKRSIVREIEED